MFSFFKKKQKMVGMNVSPWLLDETSDDNSRAIRKEMIVYRDGEIERRVQVVYTVRNNAGTEFDIKNILPDFQGVTSKTQHLTIFHSPCLSLGDGYMVARLGNTIEEGQNISLVNPITSAIEISDHPNKGFTLMHFTDRMDVIKVANLFGKADDVAFELYGNPDKTLYLRFPISNEPGFGQLRELLLTR